VRQKFMDFHAKHYSANRMKLVVLGREPLDTLEEWAADLFAGVRNKSLPQNRWETEVPFAANDLSTQCFAKPVMDSRELDLSFPFIDEELLFESQPSRYISHLIGHEGPGSIMSYIKAKGWANGLSAGMSTVFPPFLVRNLQLLRRHFILCQTTFALYYFMCYIPCIDIPPTLWLYLAATEVPYNL